MATSGSARLLTACVILTLVAGCSGTGPARRQPQGASPPATAPATARGGGTPVLTTPTTSAPGASAREPADPTGSDRAGCAVTLPRSWQRALTDGRVDVPDGERLEVQLAAADGTTFAVSTREGKQHRLQWRRGNQHGTVQDFGLRHPDWQVLSPTFDGRHLAYRVDQSLTSFDDFSLYLWDSATKKAPVQVTHGERDPDGALMATPFVDPVLAKGWLYWTQTQDQDPEHTVLSGYRIDDGHREVISRGFGRAPVRFGDHLVWADSDRAGQTSSLRFLDLATHKRVPTPQALRTVTGIFYLAGDRDTLVWVAGAKGDQVWAYRSSWSAPHLLVARARTPQFPHIAGDVVVFGQPDAMYAADLRSWSYTQVTPRYGGISADDGPVITVGYAPNTKSSRSVQSLLDTREVPPLGRVGC